MGWGEGVKDHLEEKGAGARERKAASLKSEGGHFF